MVLIISLLQIKMQRKCNGHNNSKVKNIGMTIVTKCFPRPGKQNNCHGPSPAGASWVCISHPRPEPSKASPVKPVPSLCAAVPTDRRSFLLSADMLLILRSLW